MVSEAVQKPLMPFLQRLHPALLTAYCSLIAFSTYFCAYAYRKPFNVSKYEGLKWFGLDYKTALVLAQLVGYVVSKFLGIKYISEVDRKGIKRALYLVCLALIAQFGLILNGILPLNFKPIGLFMTGLPTGMIWGLVVTYLEGRQGTDFMLAAMSCSFIMASGAVKDVGLTFMTEYGMDHFWMPAAVGAAFFPVFVLSVFLLHQVPPPSAADVAARSVRKPMYAKERANYVKQFWPGLLLANIAYFFLCAYRDFRDNFATEILTGLGGDLTKGIFTLSETIVGFGVTMLVASLVLAKTNYIGFMSNLALIVFGFIVTAVAVLSLQFFHISGLVFLILTGLSSYFSYVPYGAGFYERKIAFLQLSDVTSAFPLQISDSIGCTGTFVIFLVQNLSMSMPHHEFFALFSYFVSALGVVLMSLCSIYFLVYKPRQMGLNKVHTLDIPTPSTSSSSKKGIQV